MRRNIEDITQELVEGIDKTIHVRRIFNGSFLQTKLYVCELKWLVIGSIITDGTNTATVSEVGEDYIVIDKETDYTWTSKTFTIVQNMYYMRGTPLAVNAEWQKLSKTVKNKTPFVWLVKPTSEVNYGLKSNLDRESDLRIYFLDKTKIEYTEQQHTDLVIKPLWAWVLAFFEVIKKDRGFNPIVTYTTRELSRFGTETAQRFESNIITANLSAIEVRFTLSIKKSAKCLCNNPILTKKVLISGEDIILSDLTTITLYQ